MANIELDRAQLEAIEQLKSGSILNGGVGSGKTRTSLSYFFVKECKGCLKINGEGEFKAPLDPKDLYVITTARKRDDHDWEEEASRFLIFTDPSKSAGGIKLTVDSWNNIAKYEKVTGAFFIFDEQRVVGKGKWAKTFIKIAKANRWILLSATPGDTWMDYESVFIANGFYRSSSEFENRHIVYNRFVSYPQVSKYIDCHRLYMLRKEILVDMEVIRETTQHHERVKVPYNRKLYFSVMKNRTDPITDEPIETASLLCYTLRKVVNSDPSRIAKVRELIKEHPRAIIFYNFDYELDILRTLEDVIPVAEWNGHKHDRLPKGERWAYLVQYTAGAEGWNCTTTDTVIFYSQNYSYKIVCQASGRIDRRDTNYRDLYYYHLCSDSVIDIAIRTALKDKKNFQESRFIDSGGF